MSLLCTYIKITIFFSSLLLRENEAMGREVTHYRWVTLTKIFLLRVSKLRERHPIYTHIRVHTHTHTLRTSTNTEPKHTGSTKI